MSNPSTDVDLIDSVQNNTIKKLTQRDTINIQIQSEKRKKEFFHETIHIKLKYNDSSKKDANEIGEDNVKEKEWRIQRFRLTNQFLQQSVDRLLFSTNESGAIIAYLKESETGEIIIPDDMQRLCRASTSNSYYDAFLSLPNKTKDVLKSNYNAYRGQMKFMLHNVPLYSQNSIHEIKSEHVHNWIIDGILREEPGVQKNENEIKGIKNKLELIIKRMRRIADEPMLNERGQYLTGKKAEMEREEKFMLLQSEKEALHIQYDEALESFKNAKKKVVHKVCVSIVQHEDKTTWEFMFSGKDREHFDNIVVNKKNWNTSFMYTDPEATLFSDGYSISDSEYLVDTGGILIERLEDGFGCFHKRNTDSEKELKSYNSHVDSYHGTYRNGEKCGYGVLYTCAGIYGGEIKKDQPFGNGVFVSNDGNILSGQFDIPMSTPDRQPNRYTRSVPNGQNEIQFSDGAFYKGMMTNGEITGPGIYVTSQGERFEGDFVKGSLVRGVEHRSSGDIFEGEFIDGLLHGEGMYECKSNRSIYKGHFVNGSKHGVGEEILYDKKHSVLSRYKGMYCNDRRSGLGRFQFRDCGFSSETTNLKKDNLHLKGYWLAGQPKSGGFISKDTTKFSVPTTHSPTSRFRWLHRLKRVESQKEDILENSDIQVQRTECMFRRHIETKKQKIYDHHKYSIKSMLLGKMRRRYTGSENDYSQILPSKSKYYAQRKINKGPTSVDEALNNTKPGLQMIERTAQNEKGAVRELIDLVRGKWSDMGLCVFKTIEMKNIQDEFDEMEEKWSIINVDKIRDSIHKLEEFKKE